MVSDTFRALHPRRTGIADALARAFPMPDDVEAKAERHLCRHIDHKAAVK